MKKIFIFLLLFMIIFNFFAETINPCTDERTQSIYENWLRRDLNDDKINIKKMWLYKLDYLNSDIYEIYLNPGSERHFRDYTVPNGLNRGYCILDEHHHFINLWKNGQELQKLIKPADVEKLNEDDKIWLLDFLYENMTETDKLWCIIINSPEAFIPNIFFEVKDDIRKKYENVKIQISDSSIEFYAITGGFFVPSRQGKAVYDLKKIVFTFDEDIGLTMEETLLEERIYK